MGFLSIKHLLTDHELDTCSQNEVKFCGIQSPIYTVVKDKLCIINLFTTTVSNKHCLTSVNMVNLPIAYHLVQNNWVIISRVDLHFDLVCNDQHTKS